MTHVGSGIQKFICHNNAYTPESDQGTSRVNDIAVKFLTGVLLVNCALKKTEKVWKECMGSLVHGIPVLEVCTKQQTNICTVVYPSTG